MKKYLPVDFEAKWQKKWQENGLYRAANNSPKIKKYILDMFPYPSGEGLHVGHFKGYVATDILSRYYRLRGFNVLHPMGWDAFGLPAENYALKTGIHPSISTAQNISNIKRQMQMVGLSYDWDREINTTDPNYYKWTQWIFIKLFEHGLAYEDEAPINWCPSCKTGLANEEVLAGECERCGTPVEQKKIRQWMLKITKYADKLVEGLQDLDWPNSIKELQTNWIGKSDGALIKFGTLEVFTTRPDTLFGATFIVISPEHPLLKDLTVPEKQKEVEQYIDQAKKKSELERKEAKEKTGVFAGSYVKNPLTGEDIPVWVADYVLVGYGTGAIMAVPAHDMRDFEFAKKYGLEIKPVVLPQRVYAGDGRKYFKRRVEIHRNLLKQISKHAYENQKKLMVWGGWAVGLQTGSEFREFEDLDLMILEEDLDWWKDYAKSLGLKIHQGIYKGKKDVYYFSAVGDDMWVDFNAIKVGKDDKVSWSNGGEQFSLPFNSLFEEKTFEGIPVLAMAKQALYEIKKEHIAKGKEIRWKEQADFVMMQFEPYEGPGALINSNDFNGLSSEEAKEKITNYLVGHQLGRKQTEYHLRDWVFSRQRYWGEPIPILHCQNCGVVAVPEEELPVRLPEVEKYQPTGTGESPLAAIEEWVNTTCPKCEGPAKRETNTMPQWAGSCWYYLRFCDPDNQQRLVSSKIEKYWLPVDWYVGGAEHAVLHLLYARFWHNFLYDIKIVNTKEPFYKLTNVGLVLAPDGRKMSKRWGNVITPDEITKEYGVDTLRVYEAFMGPFENTINWDPSSIYGVYRFLNRVWEVINNPSSQNQDEKAEKALNRLVKKVEEDIVQMKFNTAVAAMMEFVNVVFHTNLTEEQKQGFLILLAPFAPHLAEELWAMLGKKYSIHQQPWPKYDEKYLEEEEVTIVVAINGKMRDQIVIQKDMAGDSKVVEKLALESPKVQKFIAGYKIKNTVYVPVKIINFVLASD